MKVSIRYPFVVNDEKLIEEENGGQKVVRKQVSSHYSAQKEKTVIELSADAVRLHLHKLEPEDAEARKLFESVYAQNAIVAGNRGGQPAALSGEDFEAAVAAQVKKTLEALGVKIPATK